MLPQSDSGLWEISIEVNTMQEKFDWKKFLLTTLSYVAVAVAASAVTLTLWGQGSSKLSEVEQMVDRYFIGDADLEAARDAAANAFIEALGDRWSYYVPADEYKAYAESKENVYVGIGVTIAEREDKTGFDIREVVFGGSAQEQGVQPGDILIAVEGQSVANMTNAEVKQKIQGQEGTDVIVSVLRDGKQLDFTLRRKKIEVEVAKGQMLPGNIGLVRINNFNTGCADETIAAVKQLQQAGAVALIFDVRNNPGGYVNEMVKVLDYLLPEDLVLFREENYRGKTNARYSDATCVELPIAVVVNARSYSAAEFFPAALSEHNWATVVGEKTVGKGYYQNTLHLSDGSALNLSTGKYFTPKGNNLSEMGGLTPDVPIAVTDEKMDALIYAQLLPVEEDIQIQAAVATLLEKLK